MLWIFPHGLFLFRSDLMEPLFLIRRRLKILPRQQIGQCILNYTDVEGNVDHLGSFSGCQIGGHQV